MSAAVPGRGLGRTAPPAVAATAACATALVAAGDPERPGHYPVCPFHAMTGLWCPGCGSLRTVHALTRGDLGTALHRNLLLVALLPVLGYAWVLWLSGRRGPRLRARHGYLALAVVVGFGVARNLPGLGILAP